jgi:hypothetical protein
MILIGVDDVASQVHSVLAGRAHRPDVTSRGQRRRGPRLPHIG